MKSFVEEDNKEGRYFPSEGEMPILVNYLQIYFSHPERSLQRSQVVQQVVTLLSTTNKHWSHRTVRLWFNNNKKVFFHQPNSQNQNQITERKETQQTFQPPKKMIPHQQPPRSLSVAPFSQPNRYISDVQQTMMRLPIPPLTQQGVQLPPPPQILQGAQLQPPPLIIQPQQKQPQCFADQIMKEMESAMTAKTPQEKLQAQLKSEQQITQKLISMNEQRFEELVVSHIQQQNVIKDQNSFMTSDTPSQAPFKEAHEVQSFELIEASTIIDDKAAVVAYTEGSDEQQLFFNGMSRNIELNSPVSSMTHSTAMNQFFVHSDGIIKSFNDQTLEPVLEFTSGSRKSMSSAMTFWEGKLVLACGSSILYWSDEALVSETPQFTTCLTSYLKNITSIAAVSDFLVVGSNNHHTPHIFATNGTIVKRPIGHIGGITALSGYDSTLFLTGSSDQTVKLWDMRTHTPEVTLARHKGIITALNGNDGIILSGATDGVIRGWDVRSPSVALFSRTGSSAPLEIGKIVQRPPEGNFITAVTSEKASDCYIDLQKYGELPSNIDGISTNGILSIQL